MAVTPARIEAAQAEDAGASGFPCPACGGGTTVLETRRRDGWLQRRRQCLQMTCRHRFSTHERTNFWLSRHEGSHEGC